MIANISLNKIHFTYSLMQCFYNCLNPHSFDTSKKYFLSSSSANHHNLLKFRMLTSPAINTATINLLSASRMIEHRLNDVASTNPLAPPRWNALWGFNIFPLINDSLNQIFGLAIHHIWLLTIPYLIKGSLYTRYSYSTLLSFLQLTLQGISLRLFVLNASSMASIYSPSKPMISSSSAISTSSVCAEGVSVPCMASA